MPKFVINRSKWFRGQPVGNMLLRPDGRMCCLGFFALACGLPTKAILGVETPDRLAAKMEKEKNAEPVVPEPYRFLFEKQENDLDPELLSFQVSGIGREMMAANDSLEISEFDREDRLTRMFKHVGWDVEFVDSENTSTVGEA